MLLRFLLDSDLSMCFIHRPASSIYPLNSALGGGWEDKGRLMRAMVTRRRHSCILYAALRHGRFSVLTSDGDGAWKLDRSANDRRMFETTEGANTAMYW